MMQCPHALHPQRPPLLMHRQSVARHLPAKSRRDAVAHLVPIRLILGRRAAATAASGATAATAIAATESVTATAATVTASASGTVSGIVTGTAIAWSATVRSGLQSPSATRRRRATCTPACVTAASVVVPTSRHRALTAWTGATVPTRTPAADRIGMTRAQNARLAPTRLHRRARHGRATRVAETMSGAGTAAARTCLRQPLEASRKMDKLRARRHQRPATLRQACLPRCRARSGAWQTASWMRAPVRRPRP